MWFCFSWVCRLPVCSHKCSSSWIWSADYSINACHESCWIMDLKLYSSLKLTDSNFNLRKDLRGFFSSLCPLGLIKKDTTYNIAQPVILCKYLQKSDLSRERRKRLNYCITFQATFYFLISWQFSNLYSAHIQNLQAEII